MDLIAAAATIQYYDSENRPRFGVVERTFSAEDTILWIIFVCLATPEELRTYCHNNTSNSSSSTATSSGNSCGAAGSGGPSNNNDSYNSGGGDGGGGTGGRGGKRKRDGIYKGKVGLQRQILRCTY